MLIALAVDCPLVPRWCIRLSSASDNCVCCRNRIADSTRRVPVSQVRKVISRGRLDVVDRFSLINISTYQFLISIFVYRHCMFIKRVSEVVSVRVIQRLRCSTLSNKFLISRELISKYRKYDSMRIPMSTCTHKKPIRQRLLATCWTTIMRKSSCDLKTNKRTRIKGEGPRRRLKFFTRAGRAFWSNDEQELLRVSGG